MKLDTHTLTQRIETRRWVAVAPLIAMLLMVGCQTPRGGGSPIADAAETNPLRPRVELETTLGNLVLELDAEASPITVINFVDYIQDGFYNGITFHRVVEKTVIQGGGYLPDMTAKTDGLRATIPNEWPNGLVNRRYTIGMVRRPGVANSARSEFYINLAHNLHLDEPSDKVGYTVFGKVVDGFDTIEKIRRVPVATHPRYAEGRSAVVPIKPVVIRTVRLITPFDRAGAKQIVQQYQAEEENRLANLIRSHEEKAGNKAVTSKSGLIYVDLVVGGGAMPVLESEISILYIGTFVGGVEFESRLEEPLTIKLDTAIKGWQEGLQTMKEGGERLLIVPSELGFGSGGIPGMIPPDSTLVFEITLLQVD
ncbi:MAG: peptidylprolyl isomerase [Planctomycetes bacterium]|nr:peptidylprolyl isomerase [Planctomycetota bacterium]